MYARLQIFIQLSPTLTKLCHIKRDYLVYNVNKHVGYDMTSTVTSFAQFPLHRLVADLARDLYDVRPHSLLLLSTWRNKILLLHITVCVAV